MILILIQSLIILNMIIVWLKIYVNWKKNHWVYIGNYEIISFLVWFVVFVLQLYTMVEMII